MKINYYYTLAIAVTIFRQLYDLIVKFISSPIIWAAFYTVIYGWVIFSILELRHRIKVKSRKRILIAMCSSWVVMILANWVGAIFSNSSKEFAHYVNNHYLDSINALILGISIYIAWKGQSYLIKS